MQLNSARQAWMPVAGFENTHKVSAAGEVVSLEKVVTDSLGRKRKIRGKTLKPTRKSNGYYHLTLCDGGRQQTLHLHRIVLEAFEGAAPEGCEALHRDGEKSNNRLGNLRWGTHSENCVDRSRHGGTGSVLSYEVAQKIRADSAHMTRRATAEKYGVSTFMVMQIVKNRLWNTPLEVAE